MSKYFNLKVNPTIPASLQASAFGAGDVLADWFAFDMPKGGGMLKGITAIIRGTDGSANTARDMSVYFANPKVDGSAPGSLGTVNGTAGGTDYYNDLVSGIKLESTTSVAHLDRVLVMTTGGGGGNDKNCNIVLQGRPSLTRDGYNTIYVALLMGGSGDWDFSTTVLARGGEAAGVTVVETDKGSNDDPDAELIFAVGDVLHSVTDDVLGTVASIAAFGSSKQDITFAAATEDIIADNEEIYNISPITLILHFES